MARMIRSQIEDAARIQAEKEATKEQEEQARVKLNELSKELEKMQEEFEKSTRTRKEAEQDLEKFYEEEKKVLEHLNAEKEKKQAELKRSREGEEKLHAKLLLLIEERAKLQNKIRSAKGVAISHSTRRIRNVNQSGTETETKPISEYNTSLIIPDNLLFTKANVGDYVSYVGEGDQYTTTWRVWKKTNSGIIITPVLDCNCIRLGLFGIRDYLDIVKNAVTQTDKINRACKTYYANTSLRITAENIRSMTIEDINEVCGFIPPEIAKRYAYYRPGINVSGEITYNGNSYIKTHSLSFGNRYTESRFYTYDGGGVEETDLVGYKYRKPEWSNPVYASNTYYCYDPSNYTHVDNNSVTVGSMLGSFDGWLASTSVYCDSSYASFDVFSAMFSRVTPYGMEKSNNAQLSWLMGLHPLISLSSMFQVVGGDGTEKAPWQISR